MFQNIPGEMRLYRQWVVWRLELRDGAKPTKVPYNVRTGFKASVTNSLDWSDFQEVIQANFSCQVAVDPGVPVSVSGYSGIGFVFTLSDPFSGADLDDTHGDKEAYERQLKIFQEFDSYSELSPSGTGLHIIVKGTVPHGRRRACIEVYSSERFFTMTGNVFGGKYEIKERQDLLTLLWEQMGSKANDYTYEGDGEQKYSDEEILAQAMGAANGDKFSKLWSGDWQDLYPSQSEADFALVDILAFYTQNRAQIRRLFRLSYLGNTPKDNYKHRGDRIAYVEYMVNKSFDRQLPQIDFEALKIQLDNIVEAAKGDGAKPGGNSPPPMPGHDLPAVPASQALAASEANAIAWPPGLVGKVARYIYLNSPTPVYEIAYAGAIAFLAGISGRAFNISGTGLNQYVLLLARTGAGKEAMAAGIGNIMAALLPTIPYINDFKGPGQIASAPGLIRSFNKSPTFFSIIGEFGYRLKDMANDRNPNGQQIKSLLLQLFNKSGKGNVFDYTAYSDIAKNIAPVVSPSLTLLGESTPAIFYSVLNREMVISGALSRFMIIEYKGPNKYYDANYRRVEPPLDLIEEVGSFVGICQTHMANRVVHDVAWTDDAKALFGQFGRFATDQINNDSDDVKQDLWNRANIKAMKLAALLAVGINPVNPLITLDLAQSTTNLIFQEITDLIEKFTSNEVGEAAQGIGEDAQLKDMIRVISEYSTKPFDKWRQYQVKPDMFKAGVIPYSALHRRLICITSFVKDKIGPTNAIKRQLDILLATGDLVEMPKAQVKAQFGSPMRAFAVANPERFHQRD